MSRHINKAGLDLVKEFEGCILYSYDDYNEKRVYAGGSVKGVLTIGYGHTGSDVKKGMTITKAQADKWLAEDMAEFEKAVESNCSHLALNDNQFSALVSFAFNCGVGNLRTLIKNRTKSQIAQHITAYNKASGRTLAGLTRRRNAELKLYNTPCGTTNTDNSNKDNAYKVDTAKSFNASLTGTYTTTASGLNLRTGAGTKHKSICVISKGGNVKCYGYYTTVDGTKWLLVQYKNTIGFCSKKYLAR